ncbi:unnamed protein product, partial [Ectocarpus sp. 12 AP-2014]
MSRSSVVSENLAALSSPHHQRSRPSSHLTHTCTAACAISSQPLRRRSPAALSSVRQKLRGTTFHHAWRRRACSEYKFGGTAVGANASANFPANYCDAPLSKTPSRPTSDNCRTRHPSS